MFYSKEILTRKKGGFGIIWLAATLGSGSKFRKLSKKEVNSVDLVKACKFVSSPPEPLALRLTSNLMIGISRVYNQQYHFYYTDVNVVYTRLHKAFRELQGGESVDMLISQARPEAITLEDDPYFEMEMNILSMNQERNMVPDVEELLDWGQLLPTSQVPLTTVDDDNNNNITRMNINRNLSQRSLITLPDASDQSFSISSNNGFNGSLDFGSIEDDILMTEDSGIRIDFDEEGGLLEFPTEGQDIIEEENQQQQQHRNEVNPNIEEIVRRVREEHDDAGHIKDVNGRENKRKRIDDDEIIIGEGGQEIMEVNYSQDQIIEDIMEIQTDHIVPMQNDSEEQAEQLNDQLDEQLQQEVQEQQEGNQEQRKRKKRRRLYSMFDEDTEMTNKEILEMREIVIKDLDEAERTAKEKALMQEYKNKWQQILYTPVLPIKSNELATLWNNHCAPMLQNRVIRQRKVSPVPDIRQNNIEIEKMEDDLFIDDIGGPSNFNQSQEQQEKDISLQDIELERLRRGGASQSSSAIIPLSGIHGTSIGDVNDIAMDFENDSSVGTARSARSRDVLDVNILGGGALGRQSLNRKSVSLSEGIPPLEENNSNIGIPDFPIFGMFGGGDDENINSPTRSSHSHDDHHEEGEYSTNIINNEHEQMNFLESMKSLMHEAQVTRVIFQDIMKAQHIARFEVAKGFYNILGLATKDLIKVKQSQSYGDILIEIENENE